MRTKQRNLVIGLRRAMMGCMALGASGTAWAQQASAPATGDAATTLDRIVVTAQSREQELKDVPIALQVVGEDVMEQTAAENLGDLDSFVPGLSVSDDQPTQAGFKLRGLSTGDFGIGTDPTVGVYVDGVYAGRGGGTVLPFLDVERIEVLKGPQGTLFGRNTAAGAVSIITKRPSDHLEGRARVRVGNYGKQYFDGMLNLPAGEDMAFRINALYNRTDGWLDDAATGEPLNDGKNWATRAAFRWDISDNTQMLLSWDHEDLDQRSHPTIGIVDLPAAPGVPPVPADPAGYEDPIGRPAYTDVPGNDETRKFDGATLILDHAFEWGHLSSMTAWRNFDTYNRAEEDGTNRSDLYLDTINIEDNTTWYQEFKFSGNTGSLDWVAGASWFQEKAKQSSVVDLTSDSINTAAAGLYGLPLFSLLQGAADEFGIPVQLFGNPWRESYDNTVDSTAYAAFGDVIWHATDKLNVTFGLRYTRDQKKFSWFNDYHRADALNQGLQVLEQYGVLPQQVPCSMLGLCAPGGEDAMIDIDAAFLAAFDLAFSDPISMANKGVTNRAKHSWSDWSPRFVVDYHPSEDTMVFASLAKGYKAGGYNAFSPGATFDNEDVWNFETGIKRDLRDLRMQYEASAFYYVYDNRQAIRLDTSEGIPRYVVSTSDLTAWGLDFSARWHPTDQLSFDFATEWIDSTYKDFITPDGRDLSGEPTGEANWSFAAGVAYTVPLAANGDLLFSLRHSYNGRGRCNSGSASQGNCGRYANFTIGEERNRTDVYVRWRSPSTQWSVAAYANNVFDNRYVNGLNTYGTTVIGTTGAGISEPRFYGMEVQYQF
ncbi:TonB-dependent receptor [Pseudoxanthomonas helianthi]|uniref:TonB-dependent receptor n=1 Tax=Pseudoxanthomonas helianthi TaxID=1453541 RepID=A0A940X4R8_9GAMM|nr:TonB-dependent receptor [Pseudoxanthomonas helianthi]MBP3984388.1 TonB-dependent receptor [Pseudoxanthomonas helianthi]